ncbi:Der GTPase-activating protein YihI, partial [Pseudomonas aeruginosa]
RKTGRGAETAVADPRIGSKKPVPLFAEGKTSVKPAVKKPAEPVKARLSPEEELAKLENDERLDALLLRLENNETLTAEENTYVDTMLE